MKHYLLTYLSRHYKKQKDNEIMNKTYYYSQWLDEYYEDIDHIENDFHEVGLQFADDFRESRMPLREYIECVDTIPVTRLEMIRDIIFYELKRAYNTVSGNDGKYKTLRKRDLARTRPL